MVVGPVFYFMLTVGLSTLIKGELLYFSTILNASHLIKKR